jgi:glycosyltransferase involved in cell wall biosynthesis
VRSPERDARTPSPNVPPPAISLILATVGEDARLADLLASLRTQTFRDFEAIVVDQSGDDRLVALVDACRRSFALRHVRHARGQSRSRNAGLRLAAGAIVGFPDDDCRYDADVLERVHRFLANAPDIEGLTGRAVFDAAEHPPARFARRPQWVVPAKVWTQGISCTIYLRRALVARNGPFDEGLGLGSDTRWIAAEESEYLLRAVKRHARIWYDPDLTVHHPGHRGPFTIVERTRGHAYARAMGHVMRLHAASVPQVAYQLARPVGGALVGACPGRHDVARVHLRVLRGRWRGWRDCDAVPRDADIEWDLGVQQAAAAEPERA